MNDNNSKIFVQKSIEQNPKNNVKQLKAQLEWIKRQLDYSEFSNSYKIKMSIKKGEIFEFDWGVNINAEFSNRHYGVVLKDSMEHEPLVLVCPLKTNKHGAHPASDIDLGYIESLNSEHKTLAVVNQIRTLDKMRIFTRGAIGDSDIYGVKIPTLDPKKVENILTAYFNLIYSKTLY